MKEPISRYFQMGTLTWMSFPSLSTLEAVKRVAADEYFTAVEVRSCRDDAEREEVRRVLEQAHLTVYYGAHPDLLSMKLNPNAMDEAERKAVNDGLNAWLRTMRGNYKALCALWAARDYDAMVKLMEGASDPGPISGDKPGKRDA